MAVMPGAFLHDLESPSRPTSTTSTTKPIPFIVPPTSSAATSLSNSLPPTSINFDCVTNGARKRPRIESTPRTITHKNHEFTPAPPDFDDALSPGPLINANYRLAGGLDTPGEARRCIEEYNEDEGLQYRRNRFNNSYFPDTTGSDEVRSPVPPESISRQDQKGWGKVVLSVTGKAFNFCAGVVRGFYAGGGQGYTLERPRSAPASFAQPDDCNLVQPWEDVFHKDYRSITPIPGHFPADSFIDGYMDSPYRVAAAVQEAMTDDMPHKSWVFVQRSDAQSRSPSPARKKIRPSSSALDQSVRRPASRASAAIHSRPSYNRSSFSNASFASSRAVAPSTASRPDPSPAHAVSAGHKRSRSSIASPRQYTSLASPDRNQQERPHTPASPEVKQFRRQVKRQDRVREDSIKRLTAQTEDLIRLGREALGTRIEVAEIRTPDDELEDEGYAEGEEDYDYGSKVWS